MELRITAIGPAHYMLLTSPNLEEAGSPQPAVQFIFRVVVGVRRVHFCTSYIRKEPFDGEHFPLLGGCLCQQKSYTGVFTVNLRARNMKVATMSGIRVVQAVSEKRRPRPAGCNGRTRLAGVQRCHEQSVAEHVPGMQHDRMS